MEKTAQNLLNERLAEGLHELAESMVLSKESRNIMMKLIQFEGNRIDKLENKIDLLMTERAEAIIDRNLLS